MGAPGNIVFLCFFFSGLTSLVLENLWIRMLTLVFGSTTLAVSSVLTSFMGGLALGSWLFGRLADRARRPLAIYAALEGAVGLWALALPLVVGNLYPHLNRWLWATFQPEFVSFSFLRFLFTVVLVLPPATLMGGTLPILSRHVVGTRGEYAAVGARAGWLYAVNTVGAVAGALLSGFVLMPVFGVSWTNVLAATVNCVGVAALLLLLERRIMADRRLAMEAAEDAAAAPPQEGEPPAPPPHDPLPAGAAAVALAAFGVSGLAAMAYQVIWSRVLGMVLGSSIQSFTVILSAFLVGIAGGSAAFSPVARRTRRPLSWLAAAQLWIAAAAVAGFLVTDRLPFWFAALVSSVKSYSLHVGLIRFFMLSIAFAATLPATLAMGATFPLTVQACCRGLGHVGRDVGRIYAVNTVGAIVGSFASAFVLVPLLSRAGGGRGLQWSLIVCIALNTAAAVALAAAGRARPLVKWAAGIALPAALALLVVAAATGRLAWDPARVTVGAFRVSLAEDILDKESWGEPEVAYYFDGISTTVSVERWGRHVALKNNGKVDASNGDDMVTQVMVAALPYLLHPATPDGSVEALLVGWGSGVSAAAALRFPQRRLDVVELEKRVVDASRAFADVTALDFALADFPYVREPRLRIIANDGRNYLSGGARRYDIIVSEPSNPWITGVANLFTLDHFRTARGSLKEGGVFCQWVQLYEMSPTSICSIFKSFALAFPHVAVFGAEPRSSDTLMIGSDAPLRFDAAAVARLMQDDGVRELLAQAGIGEPLEVFSSILFGRRAEVLAHCAHAPVNTDDNAYVEFAAPGDMIGYEAFEGAVADLYGKGWRFGDPAPLLGAPGGAAGERSAALAELALALVGGGRDELAMKYVTASKKQADTEMTELAALVMGYLLVDGNEPDAVFDLPVIGPAIGQEARAAFDARYERIVRQIGKKELEGAFATLLELPEELWTWSDSEFQFLTAYLEYHNGRDKDAAERLAAVVDRRDGIAEKKPEIYYYLAKAHHNSYNQRAAVKEMKKFVLLKLAQKLVEKTAGAGPVEAGAVNQ